MTRLALRCAFRVAEPPGKKLYPPGRADSAVRVWLYLPGFPGVGEAPSAGMSGQDTWYKVTCSASKNDDSWIHGTLPPWFGVHRLGAPPAKQVTTEQDTPNSSPGERY